MSLSNPFSRRLYLRIWLAVVGGMAVLTLTVGWAWRIAEEQKVQNTQPFVPPSREMVLRDPEGNLVLRGLSSRQPGEPGEALEFQIQADNGQIFSMQIAPRPPRPDRERGERGGRNQSDLAFWTRPPFGFLWLLGIVGLAVAVGVYPIIRRLTLRLEALQRSVQKFGEGDLSVRVPEQGQDEVADLARQFNAAAERVETLVKSHKSLLANASHELRSPLTRIRMGLELMGGQQPSPTFRTEILRNIAELDQLVDEILLASRLDAREADVGTVELVDLIGLVAEECARVDADLDVSASPDSVEVRGVAKLLRRAIRNLLENARRYSTGEITVVVHRRQGRAEVHVCDHGPGVPVTHRERIFEPFYRLPGASERAGGVGLGLALVRSIAGRHNGTVHCQDRADGEGGACFVLALPLAPASAAAAAVHPIH
ncbi:MAG: HAMP domain-containing protein [Gammaproteobacteria bacterium]|jgi:two-component system, OmpR family, sensor kinase|nr:HAMP domain-containing protein [Gammaproteobacteria bacterium]MBU1353698.1 HAMP domain-containing protein [Gammaproteobacteria bacterium]MBU1507899.1 HAMP domain-containing protein [Gammaproteobacteria bacterium]MBU2121397.1 HAMP domain-containing protein [Gammaproteobacteria bacterium]MBU2172258.1 HAMP domain-containing protein [Gammaproteobacteria bacterium]